MQRLIDNIKHRLYFFSRKPAHTMYRDLSDIETRFFYGVELHASDKLLSKTTESLTSGAILSSLVISENITYEIVERAEFHSMRLEEWESFLAHATANPLFDECPWPINQRFRDIAESIERKLERHRNVTRRMRRYVHT